MAKYKVGDYIQVGTSHIVEIIEVKETVYLVKYIHGTHSNLSIHDFKIELSMTGIDNAEWNTLTNLPNTPLWRTIYET